MTKVAIIPTKHSGAIAVPLDFLEKATFIERGFNDGIYWHISKDALAIEIIDDSIIAPCRRPDKPTDAKISPVEPKEEAPL